MRKLLALVALLVLFIPSGVVKGHTNLQISPVRNMFTAQPGSTVRVPISLKNPDNQPVTVTVIPRDFEASPNLDGQPKIIDNNASPYSISNWLADANLDKKLTIPANQTISYEAVFRVPVAAGEKTYFGMVTFQVEEDHETEASLGSLVFITVGNPKTSLNISNLEFGESQDASKRHGVFTTTVNNTSDGLVTPKLKLNITDDAGNTVVELDQDGEGSVLPMSTRKYTFTPTAELPNKRLTATVTAVDQNGNTADKTIQLDRTPAAPEAPKDDQEGKEPSFIIPLVLALAVIIAVGITVMLKHRKQKKDTPISPEKAESENFKKSQSKSPEDNKDTL